MTEKNYNPEQKAIKALKKQPKQAMPKVVETKPKQDEKVGEKISKEEQRSSGEFKKNSEEMKEILKEEQEFQANVKHSEEKIIDEKIEKEEEKKEAKEEKVEEKKDEHKLEEKKEIKKPAKKIKKEEVYVNAKSVPVSTKYAINICKFIKGKRVGDAIRDLEQVVLLKKSVPMKGEYSHRKGRGMSGGAFPQRASKHFIILLKSLAGNANNHEIDEPRIVEASANWAPAPRGKFGRVRRKRTHITLKAVEMKIKENKKEKKK